jgi:hypothetical protein
VIFKPEMVAKILAGEKTVTRRPVKWKISRAAAPDLWFPCRYEVGKDYAVQPGRGKKAVARIRIVGVRRGLLAGVDREDARLEGFASVAHFRRYWTTLYGSFDSTQPVDRIEFQFLHPAAVSTLSTQPKSGGGGA